MLKKHLIHVANTLELYPQEQELHGRGPVLIVKLPLVTQIRLIQS